MPDVIDKASGQKVAVPDADAAEGFKAGRYQLVAGQRYQVQLANGAYGSVPAESVASALDAGATLVSPDQARAAEVQRKYGDARGAVLAGGASALSQGTLGISDQILHAVDPDALRTTRAVEDLHPVATMLGGAAGAIGLGIATGGESAAESLALRGAARLGLEEGAVAARALAAGARGTVAGLQQGVAQSISDDAFTDHHLTAQQVLSEIGGSTLWGGALGAGTSLLGSAVRSLRPGSRADTLLVEDGTPRAPPPSDASASAIERNVSARADDDVGAVAARAVGIDTPAEGLGGKVRSWYAKAAGAASGKDPEAIATFLGGELEPGSIGYANRQALLEADEVRDQAARDLRTHGDAMLGASRDLNEIWGRGLKRSYIASALDGVDADQAAHRARALVDHTITSIGEMLDNADDYGGVAPLTRAAKVTNDVSRKLDAAIAEGNVGEMYALTDDLKKGVGKYTKGASRLSPGAATDELIAIQNRARAGKLQDLYDTLRVGLEDETTWKGMGQKQAAINRAMSTQIDAADRFHTALTTDIGRDPSNPWATARGVDPGKAGTYVRGLLQPEKDLTHQAVRDYVDATHALATTMAEAFDLPAGKASQVAKIAASADAMRTTLDKAERSLTLVNQFEKVRDVTSGHASAFGALAGMAAHGVGGGIAGLALGKIAGLLTRPADTIMQLAAVEKMARESDGRIGRALRGFARGAQRSVAAPETGSYARKVAAVQRAMASPDALASRVGTNLGDLRQRAPRLADALTSASLQGLQFLQSKLPPAPPGDPLDPKRKPPAPPPAQQEQWLRYERAVERPLSVVEDLRDGRLNVEGVEVLKTVYPKLFERVQEQTLDLMSAGKLRDLDYQRRIGLGLMLGLPTDPVLSPSYILARQSAFMPQSQSSDARPRGKPVNISKMTAETTAQRVESPSLGGSP